MFDELPPHKPPFENPQMGGNKASQGFERRSTVDIFKLDLLKTDELLRLHAQVVARLPATELSKMNLEKELLLQYHSVVALQAEINEDPEGIPFNQRAQVANTVSSVLKALIELQSVVFPQERYKAVETVLIRALVKIPEEVAAKFIDDYEKAVSKYA